MKSVSFRRVFALFRMELFQMFGKNLWKALLLVVGIVSFLVLMAWALSIGNRFTAMRDLFVGSLYTLPAVAGVMLLNGYSSSTAPVKMMVLPASSLEKFMALYIGGIAVSLACLCVSLLLGPVILLLINDISGISVRYFEICSWRNVASMLYMFFIFMWAELLWLAWKRSGSIAVWFSPFIVLAFIVLGPVLASTEAFLPVIGFIMSVLTVVLTAVWSYKVFVKLEIKSEEND